MTVLAKKQLRSSIGIPNRKTFNQHIIRAGIKEKLPEWFWGQYYFYDDQISVLEMIFGKKLIEA